MAASSIHGDAAAGPAAGAAEPEEGRRSRRRRELHQRIFDTARALFLQKGFEATRVEDIAAAADIAPATFFNHFPSKEAVLREMAGEVFTRFHSLVREQLARDVSTRDRLIGFADTAARLVERGPELTRRVLLEVHKAVGPGQAGAELAGLEAEMAAVVRAGVERGDVRSDVEESLLAELAVSAIIGVMTRWIHDGAYPLRERMRQAASFLAEAFAPGRPQT
ncbi:MAG TPA: TetR/AcrR family transcriptional regulator [Candidatus Limnocylindrales bacterium]|nr:TetR/AcrR family transcriptional regulator [Candidatus Limnocylindrales bacterium]